eukprot:g5181.t1
MGGVVNKAEALAALREGKHHVLTEYVAKYEGNVLDLSDKSLEVAGTSAVAKGLQVNNTLQTLDLYKNNIGPDGAKAIGKVLEVNSSLKTLDLSFNGIGDEGLKHIAAALKENKTVIELRMGGNKIGPAGAKAIANMLKENKTVIELRMGANKIGPSGAEAIANMLKVNKSITTLNLNLNNIGPDGAAAIGKALEVNTALQVLNLYSNNIGPEGAAAIADMLKVNPILKQLYGVELKNHIQGLPQGVSDNERILEYLRQQSKIKEAAVKTAQAVPKQQSAVAADSKQASSAAASCATRVQDLDLASMGLLPPICGVMAQPLVSLAEACAGLGSLVSNLDTLVFFAAEAGKKLAKSHQQHLLTADECGSVYLYTCESDVYRQMNRALRNKDRSAVKPWFKYLRLLFSAIGKLPAVTDENVWRGLSLPDEAEATRQIQSLQEMKKDGDTLFWWGASSCTVDMDTSVQFTGGKYAPYTRIMFQVRCIRGARIETLSAIGNEKEVLLLPGSSFQIKNLAEITPKVWIVELQEKILPGNIKPVS